jgi:hypothetical protein
VKPSLSWPVPSRWRPTFLVFVLGVTALLGGLACGGDGESEDRISQTEAEEAADRYFVTTLGLFTGSADAEGFIELFAPECRQGVDPSGLDFVVAFMQALAPQIQGANIDEVDVGALRLEHTDEGTLISPEDPDALRLRVDGAFVSADDFFGQAGFVPTEGTDPAEPLLLVRREGKVYFGDCSELEGLSEGIS